MLRQQRPPKSHGGATKLSPCQAGPLRWAGSGSHEEIRGDSRSFWGFGMGRSRKEGWLQTMDTWMGPKPSSPSSSSSANSLGTTKSSDPGCKGDAELGMAHPGVSEQPELSPFAVF